MTLVFQSMKVDEVESFVSVLVNLCDSEFFDRYIDHHQLTDLLFLNLGPAQVRELLVVLCSFCERNCVNDSSFIERFLFFALSEDRLTSALSCELTRVVMLKSPDGIELDLRPNIGKVMLSLTRDQPLVVRRFACRAVGAFIYSYPEYIPFMVDLGLLECLRDMMCFEEAELVLEALLILDCVFTNDGEERRYLGTFVEMDGMEWARELLHSDNEEISQNAEVFLLSWNPVIEIDDDEI
jgi:hypothetical protein